MTTIHNLALSNLKADKTRSILITLSIFMSTLLLMAIATFGLGFTRIGKANAIEWYGDYFGTFSGVNETNIREMERRSEFTEIGLRGILGLVEAEKSLMLYYYGDMALDMFGYYRDLNEGYFPVKENEIAGSKTFFALLGLRNVEVGQRINLSYRVNLKSPFEPAEFIVSGILTERNDGSLDSMALVSKEHYLNKIASNERWYQAFFRMDESVNVNAGNAKEIMEDLAVKCGIDERGVSPNYYYLWWVVAVDPEMLIGCIVVALLIIIFSVIVIYNIFHVGIIKKIQEYGKIKAIGATKREMRKIVLLEGVILSGIGIPPGLLAGHFLMVSLFAGLFAWIETVHTVTIEVTYFSLPLMLGMAFIAFITVLLALRKPMKIVGRISPVVAMKYQESSEKSGLRKGRKELHLFGLIMANIRSQKKRMVTSIIMMGLSGVIFVVLANLVGNMDVEYAARETVPKGEFQLTLTYYLDDIAYPENNLDYILSHNPLNEDILNKVKNIPGVTEVGFNKVLYGDRYAKDDNEVGRSTAISIINREQFDKGRIDIGEFTYDEVSAQNALILGWSGYLNYSNMEIGKQESFKLFDGMSEYEWNPVLIGAFSSGSHGIFVMTEDTYINLGMDKNSSLNISQIWVDCAEADKARVESALREINQGVKHIEFYSYDEALFQSENMIIFLLVVGYSLCLLIGIISFLNLANTIITSVITRKQEFGVLQAIGMTNVQLNRCLQLEGMLFTIGTVLVANVVGIPLGYYLFLQCKKIGTIGINVYSLPILEIALMVALITVLQLVLSFVLSRNIKKESLVERIRYQG